MATTRLLGRASSLSHRFPLSAHFRNVSSSSLFRSALPVPLTRQSSLFPSSSSSLPLFSRNETSAIRPPPTKFYPKPKKASLEKEKAKKRAEALKSRQEEPKEVDLPLFPTPLLLSNLLAVRTVDILKTMIKLGLSPRSSRELLADDVVDLLCSEYFFIPKRNLYRERVPQWLRYAEDQFTDEEKKAVTLSPRAPIVTIMGHVNHGKTTLLDSLKGVSTAAGEAGGITQVVSSFMVQRGGSSITFLDTPGHAAFSQMRDCSSYASDLVVLVVAADEGVQEQTVEAISIIQDMKKKFLVAITKIDKEGANLDKVSQQLIRHRIFTDRIGGDVITVPICAPTGQGLDDLCDAILIEADNLNLEASNTEPSEAVVLDAEISKSGLAILLMTRWGTLRKGDHVVIGETYGRVRSLQLAEAGGYRSVAEVGPSTPVLVYGISDDPPNPGEALHCVQSEREAKAFVKDKREGKAQMVQIQEKEEKLRNAESEVTDDSSSVKTTSENPGNVKTVSLIIKSSVAGSAYALRDSILELAEPHDEELQILIPRCGLGAPNDVDITFAKDSGGMILCFGIKISDAKRRMCEDENIKLVTGDVIYSLLDEVKTFLGSLLTPHEDQVVTGEAKIIQIFPVSRSGVTGYIAGCQVTSGMITFNSTTKVVRDGNVVFQGRIGTLRHFKDSVKVIKKGSECGIGLSDSDKEKSEENELPSSFAIQKGDIIQTYHVVSTPRKLGEKRRSNS